MNTRSNRKHRKETPAHTEVVDEDESIPIWHPIWVAISQGEGVFKHWSLFVEDENDQNQSFIVQVQGSSGRFRYEQRKENKHESESLIELIHVGHVQQADLRNLRRTAREVEVKNGDATWNCQDFVWNVLGAIASAGLTDGEDSVYIEGRRKVWSRMEGLV
ncbi:hypothetical protein VTL71DRAFT_9884 [Oculimacula yallundae]|uniref:Uncharacterized protein n=1 Tax=Oculimacula yallundae TaxID=86028 RepID=A0ABR4BRP7_9HELO